MSSRAGINGPFIYETQPEEEHGISFARLLWQRKGIILLGLILGLGLGYLYFTKQEPVYRSDAKMLMIELKPSLPSGTPGSGSPSYTSTADTHEAVMRSPMLVGQAIDKHKLGSLDSLRGSVSPVNAIIANLSVESMVSQQSNSHVVSVSYEGSDPTDCAKILTAVIETYQEFLGDTYQHLAAETVSLINEAKDVLHRQLTAKEAEYRKFRNEAPLLWKEGGNLHELRMKDIEAARSELLVGNSQSKAKIEAIEKALRDGGSREALSLLVGKSDPEKRAENPRQAFEEKLFLTLLEEQMLLESYGPDHPKVQAERKKMQFMREHLSGIAGLDETAKPVDFLAVYLESLRQELKTGEQRLEELNRLFTAERESAKALESYEAQEDAFRSEIARTQQLFEAVMRRLEEINLVKDYNGIETKLLSPPSLGSQIEPQLAKTLGLGGLLGLLAGLGLGYLVELADKRFHSPEDIRRETHLPILGHIPLLNIAKPKKFKKTGTPSPLDPVLCTYHQSKGRQAEAYRAVRTSIYFSGDSDKLKVIQITSPKPSDGKTTLAANLAVSMANSGKKVLLVDADFRRPMVHKLFGIQCSTGLSTVVADKAELPDAICETPVNNLWVVPCGHRPPNPADLLTSARFEELLQVMREQYDVVVIDTPPLLAVTDPSAIAPRVDGVVLVTRLAKDARANLVRSTEMLRSVGSNILGIVVNGMGHKSRYGGGSYRYGYAYRYNSYNGYGNGDHVYYSDHADDDPRSEVAAAMDELLVDGCPRPSPNGRRSTNA